MDLLSRRACILTSTSFEEGCLLAVNLRDDFDTVNAVYGQLAGVYYGVEEIPSRWRRGLSRDIYKTI